MKSSSCTILLLLCLGLAHDGSGDNEFDDDDYCVYGFLTIKPNTVMTTDACVKLTCDETTTMIIDTCPILTCYKDEEIVQQPSRNDMPHPQCCQNIYCRRREKSRRINYN